ncbi:alpha/beta hydrolase [Clostridium sp. BJN0001]|uniref:alpha/beta fold hydrolase n=1 Tax=Clostridium sp. BJN0001 TaxID=2930219 RepID=UPI001FD16805|nr:alpha/beta hydrolase [Clostridium sp. BJN0001]
MFDKYFITEDNYIENIKNKVEPYLKKFRNSGYLKINDKIKLYYETFILKKPKASIVISHGNWESVEKYKELIYYFLREGYSVFFVEHRGYGRSGFLGKVDKCQVYVDNFDSYVDDFKKFIDDVVKKSIKNEDLFLYAHSMGGTIAVRFLEKYTDYFKCAVLNAPMLMMETGSVPVKVASILSSLNVKLKKGGRYVINQKPYEDKYDFENASTTSKGRYDYLYKCTSSNEQLHRGGISYGWLNAATNMTSKIISDKNVKKIKIPILMFQAGHDTLVREKGQMKFIKSSKTCLSIKIEDAKHSIFIEKDSILKPYMEKVFKFYEQNL